MAEFFLGESSDAMCLIQLGFDTAVIQDCYFWEACTSS